MLNVYTENKSYTYIKTQKTPRSSQTREEEILTKYIIVFHFAFRQKLIT